MWTITQNRLSYNTIESVKILYRQNTLSHKSSPETEQKTIHAQARCPAAGFEFTLNVCINQRKATSCSRTSFKPTFLLSSMNPQYELLCFSTKPCHTSQCFRKRGRLQLPYVWTITIVCCGMEESKLYEMALAYTASHCGPPYGNFIRGYESSQVQENCDWLLYFEHWCKDEVQASEQDCAARKPDLWSHTACMHDAARARKKKGWKRSVSVGIALLYC